MLTELTKESLRTLRTPRLRAYAERYLGIYADFADAVQQTGLAFDPVDHRQEATARRKVLEQKGAVLRNNEYSLYVNRISPACEACRTSMGSATFFVSLKCHRKCFYCFNPNQEDYDHFTEARRDVVAELAQAASESVQFTHLALTGGEPLLHVEETVAFFQTAKERFPAAHTRLYTSGDHIDDAMLARLKAAELDEIRFSVRAIDNEAGRRHTYERIALAREYVPQVMVETPVLPGTLEIMKEMLQELNRLQIFGVNLLEFCYPFANAEAYRERGYQVKNPPYRTLYDYWYAGGLPVSHSELDCLELLEYMVDEQMTIGGHYCSLENKHTGQIYQQHWRQEAPKTVHVSERDFFLKAAKVFGDDVARVRKTLDRNGFKRYTLNQEHRCIEFHPDGVAMLSGADVEVAICTYVVEDRPEGSVLRELKVELTTPKRFDPSTDL